MFLSKASSKGKEQKRSNATIDAWFKKKPKASNVSTASEERKFFYSGKFGSESIYTHLVFLLTKIKLKPVHREKLSMKFQGKA